MLRIGKPRALEQAAGFTLVELMISVVILGFGLAIIIRSYMTALAGLDTSQNYIEAMRFSQKKIDELEVSSYENNGLAPETKTGKVTFGPREFVWRSEISDIENPDYLAENLVVASVNLDWQERNIAKNSALTTYLRKKKEDKDR